MKQKFYSEHVYSVCDLAFGILAGVDGLEVSEFARPEKLITPCKDCALHDVISGTVEFYSEDVFYDFPQEELERHRLVVQEAGLSFPAHVEERIQARTESSEDKSAIYDIISRANKQIIVPSTFHVLFADRNFILAFQLQLKEFLRNNWPTELSSALDDRGRIKRVHIPAWLKKALFFRDRGQCQNCGKDISGLKSPFDELHLDHIVPLADYGNNDPTNFQLVCEECNLAKGVKIQHERARFIPYWR